MRRGTPGLRTFVNGQGNPMEVPEPPEYHHANGLADLTLKSAVQRHVFMVLEYTDGNQRWAAEELGISESTLWRILKRQREDDEADERVPLELVGT